MVDIGDVLTRIMEERNCTSVYALYLILNGDEDGIHNVQSEPGEKASR